MKEINVQVMLPAAVLPDVRPPAAKVETGAASRQELESVRLVKMNPQGLVLGRDLVLAHNTPRVQPSIHAFKWHSVVPLALSPWEEK